MLSEMQNVSAVSRVIAQATAPAFLLGAVAAFMAILNARLEKIIDRSRTLNAIAPDDRARLHLKDDIPRLRQRAHLINRAIFLSVCSGVFCAALLFISFAFAFLDVPHEPGLALLFAIALLLLIASLVYLALDARIALTILDHEG